MQRFTVSRFRWLRDTAFGLRTRVRVEEDMNRPVARSSSEEDSVECGSKEDFEEEESIGYGFDYSINFKRS